MKVILLSNPNSAHTIKWATSLAGRGIDLAILGIGQLRVNDYQGHERIDIAMKDLESEDQREGGLSKAIYLKMLPLLNRSIREFRPDILHAHYASSYGFLGALSRFHPFAVSVWGSDIFSFPRKSPFHSALIKYTLSQADKVLSTSQVMATETKRYTSKELTVIPFGVDLEVFKPRSVSSPFGENDIVVGTVKALEQVYGIEYLMRAFALVRNKHKTLPLRLLIVGGGSLEKRLHLLAQELGIRDVAVFTGQVSYSSVPQYHNMLTIFVCVSESESFGVSVVEASACEKPVVVSDVGGLSEVVEHGVTGFVVPPRDVERTAAAIEELVLNKVLRKDMGRAGRKRVQELYDWRKSVDRVIEIYQALLQ